MNQNPYRSLTLILVSAIASFLVVSNCGTRKRDRQNDRLDAIEKRLAEKKAAPETPKGHDVAEPVDPLPKPGDVVRINMVEEKTDEVYRDMTVFSSTVNAPNTGCRFSHLREEITALDIRGRHVLVQYERHGAAEELESWRKKWFYRADPSFCENGDIGVMSFEDFERYRHGEETDVIVRQEQREELARIRMLFPELPAPPAEEP